MATKAGDLPPTTSRAHLSVRVDGSTYERLVELARERHLPLAQLIARAVDTYDRVTMAAESNAAYGRLRDDPDAWAAWNTEIGAWDTALLDGLGPDEHPD